MKYSVIIPGYNIAPYCASLLSFFESIQRQRSDVEFIVIDDGSTDETYELLNQEESIVFFHQENGGVSSARNKGIDLATGEFILFLDADDKYELNIFDILDGIVSSQCDICLFNYKINSNIVNVINSLDKYNNYHVLQLFLTKEINIHICSICFRKEFLVNASLIFPVGYSFGEDIYFMIQSILSTQKNIMYIPDVLFTYQFENSGAVAAPLNTNKLKVLNLYQSIQINDVNTKQYMQYFIQRTYLYLIKIALRYGVINIETKKELKKLNSTLLTSVQIKKPLDFTLAKSAILNCTFLVFMGIKVRQR